MKTTLKEDLKRIHELTYGKKFINEQSFINKLFGGDDPKKGDLVSSDVDSFYDTLENAANSGGLTQQRKGSMTYQKAVESMQIGLLLLGYRLPNSGVDGLFGPETSNAIRTFISNNMGDFKSSGGAPKEVLLKMVELLKKRGVTPKDIKQNIDTEVTSGGGAEFTDINLLTLDGFNMYSEICQQYINKKNPNAGVTGVMLAEGAKLVMENYRKYVPPELVLAQLTLEGGLSTNPNAKPIRTNNPFNVGNVDTGGETNFSTKQEGINQYYSLIARKYLTKGKTAKDLVSNFVNQNNSRYASSGNYEATLGQIVSQVNSISAPLLATLKTNPQNIA